MGLGPVIWERINCSAPPGFPGGSEVKSFSRVRLFVTLWTVARQVPPSMGFSRQAYWSGLPLPPPGDLPDTQGSNPGLPHCRQTLYHLSHQGSWGGPKVDVFKQGVSPSVCHRPHHSPLLHTIPLTQASCHVTQAPDNTGV